VDGFAPTSIEYASNQADDQERSQQVRLMRRIYEQAQGIYVWLGRPTNGVYSYLAFDKMEEFYKLETLSMKKSRPYSPWWMPKRPPQSELTTLFTLIGPPQQNKAVFNKPGTATHNSWLGICEILRSDWWHRTWVFQEATVLEKVSHFYIEGVNVSRRESKVKFLYGSLMTSWSQLVVTSLIANHIQGKPHGLRVAPYNRRSAFDDLAETTTNVYNASLGMIPEVTIELFTRRSLCRTGHLGLIGLVPDTARKGDVISSIVGGQVMYVIRPKSVAKMEFYFVGECYIHALMDSETVKAGNWGPTMDVLERFYLV